MDEMQSEEQLLTPTTEWGLDMEALAWHDIWGASRMDNNSNSAHIYAPIPLV